MLCILINIQERAHLWQDASSIGQRSTEAFGVSDTCWRNSTYFRKTRTRLDTLSPALNFNHLKSRFSIYLIINTPTILNNINLLKDLYEIITSFLKDNHRIKDERAFYLYDTTFSANLTLITV